VIATALKRDRATTESVAASTASMSQLNRDAAGALLELDARVADAADSVHAVTDITGFGLLGHAREMAAGSGVSIEIDHRNIAYLPGAIEVARAGFLAGGLVNNREFISHCVEFAASVPEEFRDLLYDPQTSGGLLAAVAEGSADAALAALARRKVEGRVIGRVVAKHSPLIRVS
jgi:selenide,water dikinase